MLLTQSKLLDDLTIPIQIIDPQVFQMSPTLANHLQETPAGMLILLVRLQMFGQVVDASAQERYLNLRGTGIRGVSAVGRNRVRFLFLVHQSPPFQLDLTTFEAVKALQTIIITSSCKAFYEQIP
jgi:hypothetical protein